MRRTTIHIGVSILIKRAFFCSTLVAMCGCNPMYVMRAAYEESKILLARNDITDVIEDENTTSLEQSKLRIVLAARDFSKSLKLEPKESFTAYTRTEKDVLAWVLMAAKKDAFELYTWWFPIVGTVPYKGFFDKQDAIELAQELEEEGYETSIRGTEAFSTLGWFNDPLMSTTLKREHYDIVNTVIHEILHNSIWFKNHVAFNESLANFVGLQGAKEFFAAAPRVCDVDVCRGQSLLALRTQSELTLERNLELGHTLARLIERLGELYKSEKTRAEKIAQREEIFQSETKSFRDKFPGVTAFQKLNNAEIMQLRLYFTKLEDFQRLFACANSYWPTFIETLKALETQCDDLDQDCEPFNLLSEHIKSPECLT